VHGVWIRGASATDHAERAVFVAHHGAGSRSTTASTSTARRWRRAWRSTSGRAGCSRSSPGSPCRWATPPAATTCARAGWSRRSCPRIGGRCRYGRRPRPPRLPPLSDDASASHSTHPSHSILSILIIICTAAWGRAEVAGTFHLCRTRLLSSLTKAACALQGGDTFAVFSKTKIGIWKRKTMLVQLSQDLGSVVLREVKEVRQTFFDETSRHVGESQPLLSVLLMIHSRPPPRTGYPHAAAARLRHGGRGRRALEGRGGRQAARQGGGRAQRLGPHQDPAQV
jgi:hypothetical protein